ncbi:DUF4082 domain-containing protein [Flavobacterium sp. ABG]|uniref:DUF4082 domain-containing protein n=1 Tax=Flavobacterium sp. ABG TaxID=1423322 RepID=UPI00064AC79F|nr:DUF4082 domain-containing protein [Flavobacterium sp. ABG]KLT69014.1 hypothetical protein AB674_14390 [Flavobacterium sp. ABG]
MKTIKIFFTVLSAVLFSISCSSDNDKETVTNYEVENPLNSVVAQVGLKRYDYMNNPSEELGLVFTPTVKGNIKAITVKLPGASPGLRVTIWDFDSRAVLRTEIINVKEANIQVWKKIEDLNLIKDKKYLISMNNKDFYQYGGLFSVVKYPIVAANITFNEFRWTKGAAQTFPDTSTKELIGDLSFDFQQTE